VNNAFAMNTEGLKPWAGLQPPLQGRPDVVVLGVPFDRAALYRVGAAQAPDRMRALSRVFAPVTELGRAFADLTLEDRGNLPIVPGDMAANAPALAAAIARVERGTVPVVLGGDHTTVIPVLTAQQQRAGGDLAVLYIDAHPDLNAVSRGSRYSNGCALRRAIEHAEIDPKRILIWGCRDFDQEELDYAREVGITLIPAAVANRLHPAEFRARLDAVVGRHPLHVSLDIDSLDPAYAPGTGIPSAGGLSSRQLLDAVQALAGLELFGLDADEVAPPLDHADITSLVALKVIFEFLALVHGGRTPA
jgi:agmatinase